MNRRSVAVGLLLTSCVTLAAGTALAQQAADAKVRGDAYYFYLGEVYRGHAGDHAFLLNQYSSTGKPVPKEVIQEHAAAMRADIEAAQKSYVKISAAAKKDPSVGAELKGIEKHHTNRTCASATSSTPNVRRARGTRRRFARPATASRRASTRADAVHQKLLKQLKIAPLEPPAP